MINTRSWVFALMALFVGDRAEARTAQPENYASEKTRAIVGGRKLLIMFPQTVLMPTTDDWDLSGAPLVGLWPYMVAGLAAKVSGSLPSSEQAAGEISRLRAALDGHDFDGPMTGGLAPVVSGSNWVRAQDLEVLHAAGLPTLERELNKSNTRQMLVVQPRYYADHRYRNLVVSIDATILVRQIPKGKRSVARLQPDYIPVRQLYRCIVYLPDSEDKDRETNLARWSADQGALARRAIDLGIERTLALLAQNLDATKESAKRYSRRGERKTITMTRMLGWVVERGENLVLFYGVRDRSLNYIITLNP
jgi:hypothetical protein